MYVGNRIRGRCEMKNITVFLLGGFGYGLCEVIWRGYTHISMFVLGGLCFSVIFAADRKYCPLPFVMRCFFSGLFITSMELVCGCVVNIVLKLNVWDYSRMPLNLYGQICANFSLLWMLLSAPILVFCHILRKRFRIYETKTC